MKELTTTQILELASLSETNKEFLTALFPDIFQEPIPLKGLKNAGPTALQIDYGGFGRALLVSLNTSPFHPHANNSLFVNPNFKAEIIESNNTDIIVFRKR